MALRHFSCFDHSSSLARRVRKRAKVQRSRARVNSTLPPPARIINVMGHVNTLVYSIYVEERRETREQSRASLMNAFLLSLSLCISLLCAVSMLMEFLLANLLPLNSNTVFNKFEQYQISTTFLFPLSCAASHPVFE